MNKSFFKSLFLVASIAFFASCDNDANEIGTNIVGNENFNLNVRDDFSINAYNVPLGPVETTNLPINQLGIYDNPVFGKTKAHFVSQLTLQSVNPTIGENPQIYSVRLVVPYFSTLTGTDTDGTNNYVLDSIYGPTDDNGNLSSKIDLGIYESGYYMRDTDPVTGESQKYYSNQFSDFETARNHTILNDSIATDNINFAFRNDEDSETAVNLGVPNTVKVKPRLNMYLNKAYFQEKMFGPDAVGKLVNNNVFKNYFRGLFFKVAASGSEAGNLAMLNFAGGGEIKIKYWEGASGSRVSKEIVLNTIGKSVNLIEFDQNPAYTTAINSANQTDGDRKLYLKGGQGSMAVIELFKNPGEFEAFKAQAKDQWLINDASLTFFIENTPDGMDAGATKAVEPNRIYLYDLNNKRGIIDYYTDQSNSANSDKYDKKLFGGIIEKESSGRGTKYKVRLTNHIRSLIDNDTLTNVKLGLVVTENINVISNRSLRTEITTPKIKVVPDMHIANPFGTILWGNTPGVADDKKIKLTIYYTKPN
jgi:hypothetical protein